GSNAGQSRISDRFQGRETLRTRSFDRPAFGRPHTPLPRHLKVPSMKLPFAPLVAPPPPADWLGGWVQHQPAVRKLYAALIGVALALGLSRPAAAHKNGEAAQGCS